jgi:polysaccharide biosynthesis/export protein
MRYVNIALRFLLCECLAVTVCLIRISAQNPVDSHQEPTISNQDGGVAGAPSQASTAGAMNDSQLRRGNPLEIVPPMRISPGDDLDISVFGLPELTQHLRVSNSGEVSLPLIGKLHLAGLSSDEAQVAIEKRLTEGDFVNNPQVSVYVKEYTTEGITLSGEVNRPGIYSALVGHRLLDLIQTAGGFTAKAGKTITISHRADPKHPTVVSLSADADTGRNNIELLPGDTVVVSKAGIVYVVGEVNRPGGFVIEDNAITASQVLALAAGPTRSAKLNGTEVIRRTPAGLQNLALPLKKILQAKASDPLLQPDDIIWVPAAKTTGLANSGYVLSMLTSLALYRF